MNDYRLCPVCREFGWFDRKFGNHVCAPIWEARISEPQWEGDWVEVRAHDSEEAASKFCEQYDSNGDYDIIRSGSAEVDVRKQGETSILKFDISAESIPHYHAYMRQPADESRHD